MIGWSNGPRQTLARLFELNDRYALDGRDPASVGGIAWCLGALDRPFDPEQPVIGRIRGRGSAHHARRLDMDAYTAHVDRPPGRVPRTLVIGAGIAGSAAARALARGGVPVEVVDKARGPGGRLSSRRSEDGRYDHGAPSFTARDPRFVRQVRIWEAAGAVARQETPDADRADRWVATGRNSALVRRILGEIPLRAETRVTGLAATEDGWQVSTADGVLGTWDRVVITVPGPQAVDLLGEHPLARAAARVRVAPCWVGMVAVEAGLGEAVLRVDEGPIAKAFRQDVLPGRDGVERWVVHARDSWSAEHLEEPAEVVAAALSEAFEQVTGVAADGLRAHRWRYSRVTRSLGVDHLEHDGLILAGDGCLGGRVEDAWLSGCAAAGAVLRAIEAAVESGPGLQSDRPLVPSG